MEATAGVTVRPAKSTDVEAIKEVFVSSVWGIDEDFYNTEQRRAWEAAIAQDSWSTRMLEFRFFVAISHGAVVGFASHSEFQLEDLYVSAKAGGHGVGSLLLGRVLEGYSDREISLTASLNAEPIYRKFGFVEEDRFTRTIGTVEVICIRMKRPFV